MKTQIKISTILFSIFFMVLTSSCRTEFNEEIYPDDQNQSLKANSKAANLISKTTMNDGSIDNILDESSCTIIKLPIIVTINGNDITINNSSDFELIEEAINESDNDTDEVNFIFPITLISNDFSETIIENETQFEEFIKNCNTDDDIECIDFKYPFSVSVFNQDTEVLKSITFNNDNKLYRFIETLDVDDIVAIDFPITLMLSDGIEIIINNLDDLENTIEEAIDDCEENDTDIEFFTQVITSNLLEVQKFKDNQNNETNNYKDYVFDFSEDGTIQIIIESNNGEDSITNGTWSVNTRADGGLNTTLDFGTETPLNKLNKKWNVKQIKDNRIMLDDRNDDEISKDELFFKKT